MAARLSATDSLAAADARAGVVYLLDGFVAGERKCASQYARIMLNVRSVPLEEKDNESHFFSSGASMVSAKLEVDKWSKLLNALHQYKAVSAVGGDPENEHVWMPVYLSLRSYVSARDGALDVTTGVFHQVPCEAVANIVRSEKSATAGDSSTVPVPSNETKVPRPAAASVPGLTATKENEPGGDGDARAYGAAGESSSGYRITGSRNGDDGIAAYDRHLLDATVAVLRRAAFQIEAYCSARISGLGTGSTEDTAAALQSVGCAAHVGSALDESAVQIEKQIAAIDAPSLESLGVLPPAQTKSSKP